jgi:hypothetical protein
MKQKPKTRIRFLVNHRQYKVGDEVDTFDEGVARTMIERHRAVEVVGGKMIDSPPADKMVRPARVKRKSLATV